jgi:hypothetical protein
MATAWVLVDESTRSEVESKIREVLASADAAEVRARLWTAFAPIEPDRIDAPLDLWRGSWLAGLLTDLSQRATLPPVVVERARTQLSFILPTDEAGRTDDFDEGVRLWLSRAMPPLVATTELDSRTFEFWELWLGALRRLKRAGDRNELLVDAIRAFLETPTDLARPGPSTSVLGRLLQQSDFRTSEIVRDRFLQLFDDEAITSDDLWVLTSLLVQFDAAPWFERDLVVPYKADIVYRRRARDRIADRWPPIRSLAGDRRAAQGRGLVVDPELIGRWRRQLAAVEAIRFADEPESMMRQLVVAAALNEVAASMGENDTVAAINTMDYLDAILSPDASDPLSALTARSAERPGQPVGRDGVWSENYELVRGNREEMLAQIRQLRSTAGTDLGPIDASTLVREAYRGGGQDVRSIAQAVVVQMFARGPNVAIELLDKLPDAPRVESVSEMLQQVTGVPLPRARDDAWAFDTRRALVRHALSLYASYDARIDRLAALVAQSYGQRAVAARRDASPATMFPEAEEAARELATALAERAGQVMTAAPAPDDLEGLQRRDAMRLRLADGPVQQFVATQLAVLDLLTYLCVAERPAQRDRALDVLTESAARRGTSGHVLRQAVEAERAIARIWDLRFAETDHAP